jgi:hypothetical protein
MFTSIPSLDAILQCLLPVFTEPSFRTHIEVLLGWVMCLGRRTEYGVFQTIRAQTPLSRKRRHPFDRFYNFFSRSAWRVHDLAHEVAVEVVVSLNPRGRLYLVVDDTLLHKRGEHVWGLGWFRDAVASTPKRVVTASGNHSRGGGTGDCYSRHKQDLLSADPRHAASGGQRPEERGHVGQGDAPRHPGMVSRSQAGFHRRRGVFGQPSAGGTRPPRNVRRRDACRCGHLRSGSAEATQEQAWPQAPQGAPLSPSQGSAPAGRRQPQRPHDRGACRPWKPRLMG